MTIKHAQQCFITDKTRAENTCCECFEKRHRSVSFQ